MLHFLMFSTDGPDNIQILSDALTNETQAEGSLLELTCISEANPSGIMSIWRTNGKGANVKLAEDDKPSTMFTAEFELDRTFSGENIYCQVAAGPSSNPMVSDRQLSYKVSCK